MEVQVKELINRIKSEGIGEAEKKAKEIENAAQKNAQQIIADANKKAEEIVEKAKSEAEKFEITGNHAITQAGRDLILTLRSEITAIFDTLIGKEARESLNRDMLKEVIVKILHAWMDKGITDISLLLSNKDLSDLNDYFTKKLSDVLKKGVTISGAPGIEAGFRISEKDSSAFYDITDKGIAEALCQYLNPRLSECIGQAVKKGSGA